MDQEEEDPEAAKLSARRLFGAFLSLLRLLGAVGEADSSSRNVASSMIPLALATPYSSTSASIAASASASSSSPPAVDQPSASLVTSRVLPANWQPELKFAGNQQSGPSEALGLWASSNQMMLRLAAADAAVAIEDNDLFGSPTITTTIAQREESTWSQLITALFYQSDEFDINWFNFILALILIMLMLTTAIGNLFVIVAILIERNLRTIGNYLVLSLAIADLLVACLVMPLAGIYQILQSWTLGVALCDVWTSADVFCCTGK